jgi:hypothetical protein
VGVKRLQVSGAELPEHYVRETKEIGAPYMRHTIYVLGQAVASRLTPFSEREVESIVREHHYAAPRPGPAIPEPSWLVGKGTPTRNRSSNPKGRK